MSTPTTRASAGPPQAAFSSSIDAEKISEPPWAMPVSTIRSGWSDQISSCIATMSCGYWMIGRPSQAKLYEYLAAIDAVMKPCAAACSGCVGAVGGDAVGDLAFEFRHGGSLVRSSGSRYRCAVDVLDLVAGSCCSSRSTSAPAGRCAIASSGDCTRRPVAAR